MLGMSCGFVKTDETACLERIFGITANPGQEFHFQERSRIFSPRICATTKFLRRHEARQYGSDVIKKISVFHCDRVQPV